MSGIGPSDDLAVDGLDRFIARVASPDPLPAGGGVAAATTALAAGLVAQLASRCDEPEHRERAEQLRARATELIAEDVAVYRAVLTGPRTGAESDDELMRRAAEPPAEIAETAAEVAELAARTCATGRVALRSDAAVAGRLAAAAAEGASRLVAVNLAGQGEDALVARASAAVDRAASAVDELVATLP